MRSLLALLFTLLAAVLVGVITGFAGRVVSVLGLYDVVAALALSVVAVALHHVAQRRPGPERFLVASLAALTWLGAHRTTDAWAFRQEQGQAVLEQTDLLAADFIVSGADTPLQLVDAGLAADTGVPGLRGALLVQLKTGVVVHRALGATRVLPAPSWLVALFAACEAAFVTLVVARALGHLRNEPVCATCGRFLRRRALGPLTGQEVARLADAWSRGDRQVPTSTSKNATVALAYEDTCPQGHSHLPGYAAIRSRRRTLFGGRALFSAKAATPGPLASLAPEVAAIP